MNTIFKTMVELQHKFNEQTIENYLSKNLDWNSAIIAESGELLDSLGYKWWKKQVPDMDNVKVEAIDLLHFVISEAINQFKLVTNDYISDTIQEFQDLFNDDNQLKYFYFISDDSIQQLISELNFNQKPRFLILKLIFQQLNMTNEDVYIAYIVKNCLNKFRQDNGYKEGTYIKVWNDREDNVVAYEIANEWGANEELFEQLYMDLETYYNENVLKVKKDSILDKIDFFNTQTVN